jgi:hypothetical protein
MGRKRKGFEKKRAAYLKKRARQFTEHAPPAAMKPHYRRYQPLVHQGRLSDAQCRALGSIVDDLF